MLESRAKWGNIGAWERSKVDMERGTGRREQGRETRDGVGDGLGELNVRTRQRDKKMKRDEEQDEKAKTGWRERERWGRKRARDRGALGEERAAGFDRSSRDRDRNSACMREKVNYRERGQEKEKKYKVQNHG